MAPERFSGTTDHRADIYSLACVLHECLTGQRPYPGDSPEQQLAGHLTAPPPQPSTICPDIPPALDAVIARGMAKDPDGRYQTATELADAARAALAGTLEATAAGPWLQAPTQRIPRQPAEPATAIAAPPQLASPSVRVRVANYLLAFLTVLIGTYLLIVFVVGHNRPEHSIDREGGTRIRLTALTPPDGSTPTRDTLSEAQRIIASRANGLGISGSQVVVDGDNLVITVPRRNGDDIRDLSQTGRLYIRPVINSMPAQPSGQPPPPPQAPGDPAEGIANEKKWRQSTTLGVQTLALQFQATRCDRVDVLASNDDPNLPLVTCSTDHKAAYLLGPSILGNDQIDSASSGFDERSGQKVVKLNFKATAAQTWTDYTAAHIGTQVAFTLDSAVVTAPSIREAISTGRVQIAGGLTAKQARHLANVLNYHPLPLNFESSELQMVPPKPGSTTSALMSDLMSPPAGLVVAAIVVLLILICVLLYWNYPRIRARLGRAESALTA
jgi:preprotein translocase subunit SecD